MPIRTSDQADKILAMLRTGDVMIIHVIIGLRADLFSCVQVSEAPPWSSMLGHDLGKR